MTVQQGSANGFKPQDDAALVATLRDDERTSAPSGVFAEQRRAIESSLRRGMKLARSQGWRTVLDRSVHVALRNVYLAPTNRPPFLKRLYPYRHDKALQKALGPELMQPTPWLIDKTLPAPSNPLESIFFETDNVHKWLHYLPIYDAILGSLREKPIRMLEIGVARGGSMEMWRRYLHPDSTIVGLDIEPSCRQFEDPSRNMYVRIGKQQDLGVMLSVVKEHGPFDVILDDGSHITSDMIESFRYLFLHGLSAGGVYLAEDMHTNYWTGYRDTKMSFVDFAKGLVDLMHVHYETAMEREFRFGSEERRPSLVVPLLTTLLEKVEFYDSIAVFHRARGEARNVPVTVLR
jgi:hypothetical protein